MTSRHSLKLAGWYNRVVFGVIAAALATLAVQGACAVEPVVHARQVPCGSSAENPCYVVFPEELVPLDHKGNPLGLRVYVTNN